MSTRKNESSYSNKKLKKKRIETLIESKRGL